MVIWNVKKIRKGPKHLSNHGIYMCQNTILYCGQWSLVACLEPPLSTLEKKNQQGNLANLGD